MIDKLMEMSCLRNVDLERAMLSYILTKEAIPFGVIVEFFYGKEQRLFIEIEKQWNEYHKINIDVLMESHAEEIIKCTEYNQNGSDIAIDKLKDLCIKREIAKKIINLETGKSSTEIVKQLQSDVSKIALINSTVDAYNHKKEISSLLNTLEAAAKSSNEIAGITCGIPDLDALINGFEKSKFYLLAALKKTGKSRFMVQCAIALSLAGARVFVNSLEMSRTQLLSCALGWFSGINTQKFGIRMANETLKKMNDGINGLAELNWCIYREKTIPDLKARVYQESINKRVDYIFVDFLQRMRATRAKDRVREVEEIAMDLADMSRELDVGVIALCQLSGAAEKLEKDEIPNMSHVKESQGAPENADAIIIMHNPNRKETFFNENNKYIPQQLTFRAEQRYGLSGHAIKTVGDLRTCQFGNYANLGGLEAGPYENGWD